MGRNNGKAEAWIGRNSKMDWSWLSFGSGHYSVQTLGGCVVVLIIIIGDVVAVTDRDVGHDEKSKVQNGEGRHPSTAEK